MGSYTECDRKRSGALEKKCNRCGVVKSLTEFGSKKRNKSGYSSRCKPCTNMGLGNFGDDLEVLESAISYLRMSKSTKELI